LPSFLSLDWSYSEVRLNQRQHKALYVLDKVPKHRQTFWVRAGLHLGKRPEFGRRKRLVFVSNDNLKLLSANFVGLRPVFVILTSTLIDWLTRVLALN